MTTMGLYSDQAQQLTSAAGTMRQQARTIANQANESRSRLRICAQSPKY